MGLFGGKKKEDSVANGLDQVEAQRTATTTNRADNVGDGYEGLRRWRSGVRAIAIIAAIIAFIAGTLGIQVAFRQVRLADQIQGVVLSFYLCVAAILMIVAELRITACLTPFAFLKSWLGRGMFYVFVGLNVLVINGGDNAGLSALGAALIVAGVASVLTTCTWLPEDLEEKELRAQQAANHAARYAPQSPAAQNTEVAQPQAAAVAAPHAVKEEDPFAAYTRSQAEKANAAPQLASLDDGVRSPTSPSSIEISASTGNTAPAKAGPSGANGDVVSATVGTKSPRNGKDPNPFDVDLDS